MRQVTKPNLDTIKRWAASWKETAVELKNFVRDHTVLVFFGIASGYAILLAVGIGQYYIVKIQPGSDFLKYSTIIVKDVSTGDFAKAYFVRDAAANYDGYGKLEFNSLSENVSTYLPPPIDYPKAIKKGHEEQYEYIPTYNLKPGKYSFIIKRKFRVETWIGWPVEKEVTAVSDDFEVRDALQTPEDYYNEMKSLYDEFMARASEFSQKFPDTQVQYVPEIQQQVIVVPNQSQNQQSQKNSSNSGKATAPGQLKKK